jgi:hypothetical protein
MFNKARHFRDGAMAMNIDGADFFAIDPCCAAFGLGLGIGTTTA